MLYSKNICMQKFILALFLSTATMGMAQNKISGIVKNNLGEAINAAHIHFANQGQETDVNGRFEFSKIKDGKFKLSITHAGYLKKDTLLNVSSSFHINLTLIKETEALDEVVVLTNAYKKVQNTTAINQQKVIDSYKGSLAASLEDVAGVNASVIGAGQSKPIIRGLSASRVAVTENGIKQEGQQWGADHGLEIDPFNTEKVEIIKGVGTIAYGSEAMGGVIAINNSTIPKDSLHGSVTLLGKTVNDGYGINVNLKQKFKNLYYKFNATTLSYADYKIPTHNIKYLNYNVPVFNNRLKNSAGLERNISGQIGYFDSKFHSYIQVSNNYTKAGFFPGAHGIPNLGAVQKDGDNRNIEYPYQNVNHLKVIFDNTYKTNNGSLNFKVAFQNNHRQEWSKFHTHYSNQTAPSKNPDLELDFNLNTIDAQVSYYEHWSENHHSKFGIQHQYQDNKSKGYSYLLPEYLKNSFGIFATHEYQITQRLKAELGARLDWSTLNINAYYDTTLYNYLTSIGKNDAVANYYALRTPALNKNFNATNFALGLNYVLTKNWNVNFTTASNFRFPTAIELASNGIHHGAFRHEQGNANLNPEKGWAFDLVVKHQTDDFLFQVSPYAYYFTNYIYLKPSGQFSILPHGGQIYQYNQSEALLSGFEVEVEKTFFKKLTVNAIAEYLYNQQITENKSGNYALPFTPASNIYGKITYAFKDTKNLKNNKINVNAKHGFQQNRIAQNEEITPSYTTVGFGLQSKITIKHFQVNAQLSASNLFDEKYYNHSSYYRAVQIPELGRNIQLIIQIPF